MGCSGLGSGTLGAGFVVSVEVGEFWELDLSCLSRSGLSGSWIRRACRGLGALGAGFVVAVEVWELQEGRMFNGLS